MYFVNHLYHTHRTDVLSPSNSTSMVPPLLTVDGYVTKGDGATSNRLNGWLSMDVIRTVCIIISWLIILYTVSIDRMEGIIDREGGEGGREGGRKGEREDTCIIVFFLLYQIISVIWKIRTKTNQSPTFSYHDNIDHK